jgi:hypothetical protein
MEPDKDELKDKTMCVLHIADQACSFSDFLEQTGLPVYRSHEKGDTRVHGKREPYKDYGFSCTVSEREWRDLAGQIEDATSFLRKYEPELRKLLATHSVDDIRLDFPYECRLGERIAVQCDYLPPELLRLAGTFGIGIEMSLYE